MQKIILHTLIFFLIVLLPSCKKKTTGDGWTDTLSTGFIKIACDENFKSLMDAEIAVFEGRNKDAVVVPIYTNETEAIRLLVADSVRLALTTRDLNSKERQGLKERNIEPQKHLIAFDGVALIINSANNDSLIGLPALKKILTGEITEWSQINPQSPYGAIRVLFDNKESGILRYAVDSITKGEKLSSYLYALENHQEVIEKVSEMPNTIGLVGVNLFSDDANSGYSEYQNKVKMMRVGKEEIATLENTYLPYAGNIAHENYPLWRPVYVLLTDPRSALSSGFSIFLANEIGQKIILKSGLLPITDSHIMQVIIRDEFPK